MNIVDIAIAKKYTSDTADSLGSLKGAPATIKSTEPITDADGRVGQKITFEWTGTSGTSETTSIQIFSGKDGTDGYTPKKGIDYFDGEQGSDGHDGFSPTVIISNENDLVTLTVTDITGTTTTTFTSLEVFDYDSSEIYEIDNGIPSNLLYNWDFTSDIVDTINNNSATLNGCTRTSEGLTIDAGSENCELGSIWGLNRTLEIDITDSSAAFADGKHGRFIMIYSPDNNRSEGLVFRHQTGAFAFYVDGAWDSDLPIADKNYFNGKTLKFISDSNGYLSVYANDEFIAKSGKAFDSTKTQICLGGYADSFYNVTIGGIRVYEGGNV